MRIAIICVPYHGDVARWGNAQGPKAMLESGLPEALRARGHVVDAPVWVEVPIRERTRDTVTNLSRIASEVSAAVSAAFGAGEDRFALVLEGDCTHAPGAIGGMARTCGRPGVVWFDAHGDMNTMATTQTGLWGGMPFAVALGWDLDDWRLAAGLDHALRPEAAALVGASDLDPAEKAALARHPIARIDATELMAAESGERLTALLRPRAAEADAWYVHVDVDVAGPVEVPGTHTPAPHWPPRGQLLEAATAVGATLPVRAVGLAAYNPAHDPERRGAVFARDIALAAVDGVGRAVP